MERCACRIRAHSPLFWVFSRLSWRIVYFSISGLIGFKSLTFCYRFSTTKVAKYIQSRKRFSGYFAWFSKSFRKSLQRTAARAEHYSTAPEGVRKISEGCLIKQDIMQDVVCVPFRNSEIQNSEIQNLAIFYLYIIVKVFYIYKYYNIYIYNICVEQIP